MPSHDDSISALDGVRTEGAILPAHTLASITARRADGVSPNDYHLLPGERLPDVVAAAWSRLRPIWASFRRALDGASPDHRAKVTVEHWLLPLFQTLGYGRLQPAAPAVLDGRSYPVSHAWQHVPVHLVGFDLGLGQRTGRGLAHAPPHTLLQERLNADKSVRWGFTSNGRALRVLRDHHAITRSAFVEFDLERIFDGELFHSFTLLWLVAHQSRVEDADPENTWLERWYRAAKSEGERAQERLRVGVVEALHLLGSAFLARNPHLVEDLARDPNDPRHLSRQTLYRELLRLLYRLVFLFVAEDRALLLRTDPELAEARERYTRWYSTARLRRVAMAVRGANHPDGWRSLVRVMDRLEVGDPSLALPGLGSYLWRPEALEHLRGTRRTELPACDLPNEALYGALRALCVLTDGNTRRKVDWRSLAAEELGSLYESLMELDPRVEDGPRFVLHGAQGNERKTSGSYYTPTTLVECLLDHTLEPVLERARNAPDPARALESITVCDPACGSGHFLTAAARRIARSLARYRTGDEAPTPEALQSAMRHVVGRCIYGVDRNEMAVELCKVALWMEALDPGKPLSFLDGHICTGNALLGARPWDVEKGIPVEAFEPLEGDDRKVVSALRKQHRDEVAASGMQQRALFGAPQNTAAQDFARRAAAIENLPADTYEQVVEKERQWVSLHEAMDPRSRIFDAWCAAFVMEKIAATRETCITPSIWGDLVHERERAPKATRDAVLELANQYRFFHWSLAFPQVFGDDGRGGFDVVVGNPPWEHMELKEEEFFASERPEIKNAANASKRKRMIAALNESDPVLYARFLKASREVSAMVHLVRASGRFPLCARGRINTYAVFAEHIRDTLAPLGRGGLVVPTGIATDDTTKEFFSSTLRNPLGVRRLVGLFGFENEEFLFRGVHHAFKFALLAMTGVAGTSDSPRFMFYARKVSEIDDPERCFELTPEQIVRANPNTGTCPIFRTRRDAQITLGVYERVPVLRLERVDGEGDDNPWSVTLMQGLFNMASDSALFQPRSDLERSDAVLHGNLWVHEDKWMLPLYEAKMVHHYDHRFATYDGQTPAQARQGKLPELTPEQHADPTRVVMPEWWVDAREVDAALARSGWTRGWFLGWRDICRSNDSRTVIASMIPRVAVGDTLLLMLPSHGDPSCLLAILCSFVFDYIARQKVGGTHLKFHIMNQLPVLPPERFDDPTPWEPSVTLSQFLRARVLELTYTAHDMEPWARDLGYMGDVFRWDEARRFALRCEIDAAMFVLYGLARDEVEHVMDSFPVVREKDERAHGEFRTKRVVLEHFDAFTGVGPAIAATTSTPVAPPPAPPPTQVPVEASRVPSSPTREAPMSETVTSSSALLRFDKVVLEHYRGFAEPAVVPLDPRLTVFVGTNGSGKSTILQALAVAAQAFHAKRSKERAGRLDPFDIHPDHERASVTVHASYGDTAASWTLAVAREGSTAAARSDLKGLTALHEAVGADDALPLVVYYPDSRAAAQTPKSAGRKSEEQPTDAYDHALEANTDFKGFFEWYQQLDADEVYERQEKGDAWRDPRLAQVRRAIEQVLGTDDRGALLYTRLRIERKPRHRMVLDKRGKRVEVDDLSAGERSLLVLAGDLAHRLAIANPKALDPLSMPAVVLVDEVELHLHPSWQRRVIPALMQTFSRCQFAMTTHSPQVLSSVPWKSVRVVREFTVAPSPRPTEGRDSNAILAEVLGDAERPAHITAQIEVISQRIDDEQFDEAAAAIQSLAETLTESDSEVVGLRARLALMRGD